MPTSGVLSGSFNGSTSSCATLLVDYGYTQNIDNNTSTFTATLKVRRDKSGSTTYKASTPFTLSINGSIKSGTYSFNITDIPVGSTKTITSLTKTISHDPEGYKSIPVKATFDVSGTTLGTGSIDTTINLNRIPKGSSVTASKESVYMGDSVTFTINRASTDFKHTLVYEFEGRTGTIGNDIAITKTWSIPDLASLIPNNSSGLCTITCTTYNGSKIVGTTLKTLKVLVPENYTPSVSMSLVEAVESVKTAIDVYAKDLSKLSINLTGEGVKGSSIVSYSVDVGGIATYSGNSIITGYLQKAGNIIVTAKVTDSRGRTGSTAQTIVVEDYSKPRIDLFNVERTTDNNVTVAVQASVTGLEGNTPNYYIEYRQKETDDITRLSIGDTSTAVNKSFSLQNINGDNSYIFRLMVADQFYATSLEYEIEPSFSLLDINSSGKGLAIGKMSENPNGLEIDLPVTFTGDSFAWNNVTQFGSGVSLADSSLMYTSPLRYRKIGSHVFITGCIALANYTSGSVNITTLPNDYRPSLGRVFTLCPMTGSSVARVYADHNGALTLEWIKNIADGSNKTGSISWIQIQLDYFTD